MSEDCLQEAARLYAAGEYADAARYLYAHSIEIYSTANHEHALTLIDDLLEQDIPPEPELMAEVFKAELIFNHNNARRVEARNICERVLHDDTATPELQARACLRLGTIAAIEHDFAAAERHLNECADMFKQQANLPHLAAALNNLGVLYRFKKEYEKGLKTFTDRGIKAKQLPPTSRVRNTILLKAAWFCGVIYDEGHNDLDGAVEHFSEALDAARQLESYSDEARVLNSLAVVERKRKNLTAAEEYARQSVKIATDINFRDYIIDANITLSHIYVDWGRAEQTEDKLDKALAHYWTAYEAAEGDLKYPYRFVEAQEVLTYIVAFKTSSGRGDREARKAKAELERISRAIAEMDTAPSEEPQPKPRDGSERAKGPRADLETHIRDAYAILKAYENMRLDSNVPEEKRRAERRIEERWQYIKDKLADYLPRYRHDMPRDIREIAEYLGM